MTTRRGFLGRCAAGSAALAVASAAPALRAAVPLRQPGAAKFKFSLAAYSYRELLTGDPPAMTLAEFVDDCARMGLDGTELTSYYFRDTRPAALHRLRRRCFRQGLDVSGTAVGNDFAHPPGPERDAQIAHVKQWVDQSVELGAPVVRVFAGRPQPDADPRQVHRRIVEGLEECCAYAGSRGIHLALENHGGPTSTAAGLLAIVDDVRSDWFGVNLDTGNFHADDVYAELATAAPYAINVQVKVVVVDQQGRQAPTDFERLARLLSDAGYRGYLALEFEEAGDPRTECPKYLDQMREAFG